MPKNMVKIKPINKEVFQYVLKKKGSSIRKLGSVSCIDCSEKTIRREINTRGGLREQYLEQIARYLDVDSRLLSGELVKKALSTQDEVLKRLYLQPLAHINDYPFFREEQDRLRSEHIEETLKRVLSLFEISYDQFQKKGFEEQYSFQHDLFSAILPVMYKHFDRDGYGDKERLSFEEVLYQLESYRENYYEQQYADTILRETFLRDLPKGYSRNQILKMSPSDLIGLDLFLQSQEEPAYEDRFSKIDTTE